ncbi:MAG: PD-(D/E)XK nuclease-like domain-containing protein [Prevotella sp.]|nr:PD-(D/E)XK nuclease-like domain-containing protein [Prevotella sp.]
MEILRMMDTSIPYYSDLTRVSNSNIGWFLQKGPAYLHKMLTDPPPEEKNHVLERGSLIHMYLLQPEEFLKTYVVWDKSRPFSAQQEKFCQALANTVEIEPNRAILSAYKEAYSTAGKSEDKMLSEGLKIASTLKEYIDYLKDPERKQMISPSEYQMLKKIRNNVEAHKLARYIINNEEECKNYHEFHINWSWCGSIKCKSLLDGLRIDCQRKVITIYDLKTTAKLWHFEDSIEMYDYCRQLCYYTMAVEWYLINEMHEHPENWRFEYYIIGIDTTDSYEIRVFKVELSAVESRREVIRNALKEIIWHQSTDKWEHSRAYYEGDGSETLNL